MIHDIRKASLHAHEGANSNKYYLPWVLGMGRRIDFLGLLII